MMLRPGSVLSCTFLPPPEMKCCSCFNYAEDAAEQDTPCFSVAANYAVSPGGGAKTSERRNERQSLGNDSNPGRKNGKMGFS